MIALARYGIHRGVELRINWPGRLAVAPVMGSLFFAMVGLRTLGEVLLYVGLALALWRAACMCAPACASLKRSAHVVIPSLKLSFTFWAILGALARRADAQPARSGASTQEERRTMDDTFPDLGSLNDVELKDVIRQLDRGRDRDLLQAAHPARQDRHPARRASQPAAQEARWW